MKHLKCLLCVGQTAARHSRPAQSGRLKLCRTGEALETDQCGAPLQGGATTGEKISHRLDAASLLTLTVLEPSWKTSLLPLVT